MQIVLHLLFHKSIVIAMTAGTSRNLYAPCRQFIFTYVWKLLFVYLDK